MPRQRRVFDFQALWPDFGFIRASSKQIVRENDIFVGNNLNSTRVRPDSTSLQVSTVLCLPPTTCAV
jgi:hypothetical protein